MAERYSREQLDELAQLMLEVALNRSQTIQIGRNEAYPGDFVRERFRKINAMHIEHVLEAIRENHTRVYNTKAYLLAALFNSVSTLENHYAMRYNADRAAPTPAPESGDFWEAREDSAFLEETGNLQDRGLWEPENGNLWEFQGAHPWEPQDSRLWEPNSGNFWADDLPFDTDSP